MKKLLLFVGVLVTFMACEGPEGDVGPQGLPGQDGEDAVNIESFVFEYSDVDFVAPDYSVVLNYTDFEALPSDITLAFLLWGQEQIDGETVDLWRALPQTLITNDGLLQYNYDFTIKDISLFMSSEFDKSLLTANDTDDWIVRVVVVPGKFVTDNGKLSAVDLSDYYAVMDAMDVDYTSVEPERINYNRRK